MKSPKATVSYGSAGFGSRSHITGERFNAATGTQFAHVPYKGSTPLLTAALASELDYAFLVGTGRLVLAPAKTPKPVVDLLSQKILTILGKPYIRAKLETEGGVAWPATPEEVAAVLKIYAAVYADTVKVIN